MNGQQQIETDPSHALSVKTVTFAVAGAMLFSLAAIAVLNWYGKTADAVFERVVELSITGLFALLGRTGSTLTPPTPTPAAAPPDTAVISLPLSDPSKEAGTAVRVTETAKQPKPQPTPDPASTATDAAVTNAQQEAGLHTDVDAVSADLTEDGK